MDALDEAEASTQLTIPESVAALGRLQSLSWNGKRFDNQKGKAATAMTLSFQRTGGRLELIVAEYGGASVRTWVNAFDERHGNVTQTLTKYECGVHKALEMWLDDYAKRTYA